MAPTTLNDREEKVLRLVIERYVRRARPVSSKAVVAQGSLHLSSATVRGVIRSLEEKGLVSQPHTSAGRVPTDRGYRYYVDNLMRPVAPASRERARIGSDLRDVRVHDPGSVTTGVSRILSELAGQLAVALAPAPRDDVLRRIELVPLGGRRVLALVATVSGYPRTVTLETESHIADRELVRDGRLLNSRLGGVPMSDAERRLGEIRAEPASPLRHLIDGLLQESGRLFGTGREIVHCEGARFILRQPELSADAAFLGEMFDNSGSLAELVEISAVPSGVEVIIGRENRLREMRKMSVVVGSYCAGSAMGRVGVIGPTRMRYPRMVGLIEYMLVRLDEMFSGR